MTIPSFSYDINYYENGRAYSLISVDNVTKLGACQ